jgi:hypothetical protein
MPVTLDDLELVCAEDGRYDTSQFDCDDADLNDFVKADCHRYQNQWLSHTKLAFLKSDHSLVGFITLLSDSIVLETKEKKHLFDFHKQVYNFPALKIARLGVQAGLQRGGIGTSLLTYTIGLAFRMNTEMSIGCRFITVDAYPKSVSWYEKRKFIFNLAKPGKLNRSMRYDLLGTPTVVAN